MTFENFPFNFFFYLFGKKDVILRAAFSLISTKGKKKNINVTFALSVECFNVPPTVGFV